MAAPHALPFTAALALSATLVACGGTTAVPRTAPSAADRVATAATADGGATTAGGGATAPVDRDRPAAPSTPTTAPAAPPLVSLLPAPSPRDPASRRVQVRPAPLDVASLPSAFVPPPLDAKDAPARLPPSIAEAGLKVEKIDSGWRAQGARGTAVYVVLEAELGRIQIGAVAPDRNATDRVYRTCGERYYRQPTLTPARWETLTREGGRITLTVVDGWFDAQSCQASVVRTTEIRLQPVLDDVIHAFRSTCDHCIAGERVTFVTPPLGRVAATGMGGQATVSRGSFTLIHLPLRRGGAASFTGEVPAQAMATWAEGLGLEAPARAEVHLGAELQQTVSDDQPLGIAYATVVPR